MRIIIAGATGFLGRELTRLLSEQNHEIIALARNLEKAKTLFGASVSCLPWDDNSWREMIPRTQVIINLTGENIAGKPWTQKTRRALLASRVDTTRAIVTAIEQSSPRPGLYLQASAIGYYGNRANEALDESSSAGTGFLAQLVQRWEESAAQASSRAVRQVLLRTGVVLDRRGGMLARLYRPYQLFLGVIPGPGNQWLSWITLTDWLRAVSFLIEREDLSGVFNLTAPESVSMGTFCQSLGKALHRPVWARIPAFLLRLLLGTMADETLLISQRVLPERLLAAGFQFHHPTIESARETFKNHLTF